MNAAQATAASNKALKTMAENPMGTLGGQIAHLDRCIQSAVVNGHKDTSFACNPQPEERKVALLNYLHEQHFEAHIVSAPDGGLTYGSKIFIKWK